jgi:hypothetical protein
MVKHRLYFIYFRRNLSIVALIVHKLPEIGRIKNLFSVITKKWVLQTLDDFYQHRRIYILLIPTSY